jgi:hypothetical protein
MPNTKPALQAQITITAGTNDQFTVYDPVLEDGSNITVASGTYDDIHALCAQIVIELDDHYDLGTWACAANDAGNVVFSLPEQNFDLLWTTTAATSIGSILGFDITADDTGAASYTSDYQHKYGWYPHRYPARMGPWKPQAIGGEIRHTLDGTLSKKLHTAFHHTYDVEFPLLDADYVFTADATGADTNHDLEHVWQEMAQGKFGTWYPQANVTGTKTKCYLLSPYDWAGVVTRPHTDYAAYALALKFREQES